MAGNAVDGENNTAADNNDGTVSGALGNGVRDLGEGVGDAVEDVGDAVGNAAEGRQKKELVFLTLLFTSCTVTLGFL